MGMVWVNGVVGFGCKKGAYFSCWRTGLLGMRFYGAFSLVQEIPSFSLVLFLWNLIFTLQSVRYRRSLQPFQKYEIVSQVFPFHS